MLNRNDDRNEAKKMVLFCVAAASMVLLLFLILLYSLDKKNKPVAVAKPSVSENREPEIEVGKSNIVSDDLDFWDMYDKKRYAKAPEEDEEDSDSSSNTEGKVKLKGIAASMSSSSERLNRGVEDDEDLSDDSMGSRKKSDKEELDDGKHIKVTGSDGKPQWFDILEDVKKNSFDFEEYLTYDNGFLKYNSQGVRSYTGMDICGYQGTVDFLKCKESGIDFVMIKVAARGYETGLVTIDDKFVEYAQGALNAGIPIGMYFSSQAINDIEAVEEANYAVAAGMNYNVRYPIALDFTEDGGSKSRTSRLTSKERSAIAKKFCETVKAYGKTPAICASRDFLISELDLNMLKDYDIWLKDKAVTADYMIAERIEDGDEDEADNNDRSSSSSSNQKSRSSSSKDKKSSSSDKKTKKSTEDENEADNMVPEYIGTDYPYDFSMWQYTEEGTVNGVTGGVNLNMSFVNYAER